MIRDYFVTDTVLLNTLYVHFCVFWHISAHFTINYSNYCSQLAHASLYDAARQQRTTVRRYNWHIAGSLRWPLPMLKY